MINEYAAVRGMRIDKGNQSTQTKHTPLPLCASHILHDVTWGSNLGPQGRKSVINRLSYMALLEDDIKTDECGRDSSGSRIGTNGGLL
jgi:hypothetical protein